MFEGKVVLITGGTGFLGRALVKEILKQSPKAVRVFSRDEVKHHEMRGKLGMPTFDSPLRNLVGDVRDFDRLNKAMRGCDIVIHAAALKRIDMIEYNVEEAIKTNIIGTSNIVRAALENEVKKVIFVSTDKACSPVNTYGACKFVSERIIIESNYSKGDADTDFICVRYGNVINSTGSVIPFFKEKLRNNEPVPVTDEAMTRFLITSEQAVSLVFDAIKYGRGGEVFVPKIPSCKIIDLANALKENMGSKSPIEIIGIRPGEKLHELMVNDVEAPRTVQHGRNFIILSEIEKYMEKGMKKYSNGSGHFGKSEKVNFINFSSEDILLEGEELKKYLDRVGLLV